MIIIKKNSAIGWAISITIALFLLTVGVFLFGLIAENTFIFFVISSILLLAFILSGAISFKMLIKRIRGKFL